MTKDLKKMEANNFIVKIKADGTEKDVYDLRQVSEEFKVISCDLAVKDRGPFALNVLCIICRNLDKVPSWRDHVDTRLLLLLSIDCVRETRCLPKPDRVKTLACIYHVHKHVVKGNASAPPELILKLSFMPFEYDSTAMLEEYCKTYWNILADRMTYMERLKAKNGIIKLLPRLIEDVIKIVKIYDTVQLCTNILTFLVKKLHFLYNDTNAKELHRSFGEIFKEIKSKIDRESFEKLKEKDTFDLYVKLNDCFYVIAENASKINFKDCILNDVASTANAMLGHNTEISKCLETIYSDGFCQIFLNITKAANIETVLVQMLASCLKFEKNGYVKTMKATCSFMNQLMRLFVEYCVNNSKNWKDICTIKVQYSCLNLMYYLSTKKGEQFLKCDNCKLKSSLHDSLRLLFLIKHFPSLSISQNMNLTPILTIYHKLVTIQHKILHELRVLGCVNHEKCFRKLQTDIHNTAIILNKAFYYEYSMELFNIYVELEIKYFRNESDFKNICRALYNKSICELDFKLYTEAIKDAFLSLAFSVPEGLSTEKYMSLVMDIKAKELKTENGDESSGHDGFQLISVLEACKALLEEEKYGCLKPFLKHLKFSELLKHEFNMYAKLWPSIVPIAGVWRSLNDLLKEKPSWIKSENEEMILWTLYEVVLETPTVVRTIHSDYYNVIVTELLEGFEKILDDTAELHFVRASLLFLKAEYDLAEASQKYEWNIGEPTLDPDLVQSVRTFPQEHAATQRAIEAVEVLSEAVKHLKTVPPSVHLKNSLQLYQLWAVHLLHLYRSLPALQLANICLQVALHVSDTEAYIRSASLILSSVDSPNDRIMKILATAVQMWKDSGEDCGSDGLVFLCSVAIYYNKCDSPGIAARLLQMVQTKILSAYEKHPDTNLDLAVGRLMEAQNELCRSNVGGTLSAVSNAQRHYLAIPNTGSQWTTRRFTSLTLKLHTLTCTRTLCSLALALLLWRRARVTACAPRAPAAPRAALAARAASPHAHRQGAQIQIDNRLKHILGLQPSNESQEHTSNPDTKPQLLTPRLESLETMLENVVFKKNQTSPTIASTSVFAYKMPDFYKHSDCHCYACDNPYVFILSSLTSGLEASSYYRNKEIDIARNYFEGTINSFSYAEAKIRAYFNNARRNHEDFLVDIVKRKVKNELDGIHIEVLIEAAFFELSQNLYEKADDLIVRIHEIMQEIKNVDPYLKNEVTNLMITAAQLRKIVKKPTETPLELEMENLKITAEEEPRTPITKPKQPPKVAKVIVKSEELPSVKRKVIKLNLDEALEEQEVKKPSRKRAEFKIPVPVTSKPVLETITPRTRRSKPEILITKPPEDIEMTPKVENAAFFTPTSTPAEQFFTPMTSIKTYSKKSLRNNIVKKLEAEFATPKAGKENTTSNPESRQEIPKIDQEKPKCGQEVIKLTARSTKAKIADKSALKRATSPGKLTKEVKPTRSRLRNPVNFNIREDK